ncbi:MULTISPECIES: sigma 54-interacting transcriptional regulator [unclassified Acinetobacter]|nr:MULTISPECIES: sigma 54-interacting transcriptional regulator [unclassified Acinetobacter]
MVACNESLKKAVEEGRFRSDLYYRLATYPVLIPSLKERREDINLLVEYYIHFFEKQYHKTFNGFSDRVYAFFNSYDWPGNIRE